MIALLALFTGLAALAEPAQARAVNVESVRLAEGAAFACSTQAARKSAQMAPRPRRVAPRRGSCPSTRIVLRIPPVMLQADRAHE
ncbi:hypothetical protein [Croceibacterium xixiisoli]|uniref:hypothetical protein n=1 Tax=Croceibacterium xixiisoli TaxID=1476466 RepID=UPI001367C466|nr:hypothetical protein [Croceibacterium xixiisoli]